MILGRRRVYPVYCFRVFRGISVLYHICGLVYVDGNAWPRHEHVRMKSIEPSLIVHGCSLTSWLSVFYAAGNPVSLNYHTCPHVLEHFHCSYRTDRLKRGTKHRDSLSKLCANKDLKIWYVGYCMLICFFSNDPYFACCFTLSLKLLSNSDSHLKICWNPNGAWIVSQAPFFYGEGSLPKVSFRKGNSSNSPLKLDQ